MSSGKKVANAVGGKTARACDSCISKRARWYCAADDAFLCQACDSSVHSANPLARRHERVRLKTTSYNNKSSDSSALAPSWHRGFTKKARTPRQGGKSSTTTHSTNYSSTPTHKSWSSHRKHKHPFHLVPEPEEGHSDEVNSQDEEVNDEAQLLYRVPIFDPFVEAELCSPPSSVNSAGAVAADLVVENKGILMSSESVSKSKVLCCFNNNGGVESSSSSSLQGLLATEIELAQFAADVESLLGRELENECIGMEDLGLVDNNQRQKESTNWECSVKVEKEHNNNNNNNNNNNEEQSTEEEEVVVLDVASSRGGEPPFELSFDYDNDYDYDEVKKKKKKKKEKEEDEEKEEEEEEENHDEGKMRRKILLMLQLDYEGVSSAWAIEKKSPWTTPHKPNLLDHPHCMLGMGSSACGTQIHPPYGEMFGFHPAVTMGDGGREARVSRYREKRRTRLFSKKIRYEVRKLNAEKRPRMKGRFVKRASFAAPPTFSLPK